jgi:putative intracellular protease/amidase
MKKVLFIVTSHSQLGESGRATGLYLSEFAHPYEVFAQAKHELTVASPAGGSAPIDPNSLNEELMSFTQYVQDTKSFADIENEVYDAYFVVGGHGVMWDLPQNKHLQTILRRAFAQEKVIAAVCHGPAALVALRNHEGRYLIAEHNVTGFSNSEETTIGLKRVMPFSLEDALKAAGAIYSSRPNWQEYVVIDKNLITGQNPSSARRCAEAALEQLSSISQTAQRPFKNVDKEDFLKSGNMHYACFSE